MRILILALSLFAFLAPVAHAADEKCQTRMLSPTPMHEESACQSWTTSEVVPPKQVRIVPIDPDEVADMVWLKQPYQPFEPRPEVDMAVTAEKAAE